MNGKVEISLLFYAKCHSKCNKTLSTSKSNHVMNNLRYINLSDGLLFKYMSQICLRQI